MGLCNRVSLRFQRPREARDRCCGVLSLELFLRKEGVYVPTTRKSNVYR